MSVNSLWLQLGLTGGGPGRRTLLAYFGDSMTVQGTLTDATNLAYRDKGYSTWFGIRAGTRACYPIANNFGVNGDQLEQLLTRVSTVTAASCDVVHLMAGTNNIGSPTAPDGSLNTVTSMLVTATSLIRALTNAGKILHLYTIPPRVFAQLGTGAVGLQRQNGYNDWLRLILNGDAATMAALNLMAGARVYVTDLDTVWKDPGSLTGDPYPSYVQADGLHPTQLGAFYMGKAAYATAVAAAYLVANDDIPRLSKTPYNVNGGNLYTGSNQAIYGLLTGTAGSAQTITNFNHPGAVVANGWLVTWATPHTSTVTVTLSKENPRTDHPTWPGERQLMRVKVTSAGTTVIEQIRIQPVGSLYPGGVNPGSGIVAAGQFWRDEMSIEVVGTPIGLSGIDLVYGQAGVTGAQNPFACATSNDGTFIPEAFSGVLATPVHPLGVGITTVSPQTNIRYKGNSLTTDFTIAIGDKWMHRSL